MAEESSEICRTCMNCNFQLHTIYGFVDDHESKRIQISELLNAAVPNLPKIEIFDALPKYICTFCLEKLNDFYEFQNSCINSDLRLRNSLQTGLLDANLKQDLLDPLQCGVETLVKQEIVNEPITILKEEVSIEELEPQKVDEIDVGNPEEVDEVDLGKPEEAVQLMSADSPCMNESINELNVSEVSKDKNVWRCESCSLCFQYKSCLMLHLKRNSSTCTVKGIEISPERFNCAICTVTFTEKRNLTRHMLRKHNMDNRTRTRGPNKPKRKLPYDSAEHFTLDSQLNNENPTSEKSDLVVRENVELISNISLVNSISNKYDKLVPKDDSDVNNLSKEDQSKEENYINDTANCDENLSNDKSMLENDTKNFNVWECKICRHLFYHKRNLSRHMKMIHKEELPKDTQSMSGFESFKQLPEIFKCDDCDRVFHKNSSLNLHKYHHLHPRASTTCQYCNKTFKKLEKLRDHERAHRNEKAFLCSDCGKTFSGRANFAQHRLRHSSVKRYQCIECPKKFHARGDMWAHIRQVHNKKKPFVCEICGSAFKRPNSLRLHSSIHTGDKKFKCEFCDKRLSTNNHLQRHRRTHTGEKPFKCQYCLRCYKSQSDLRKHLGTHLGENSFLCELCPAAFRLARDLQAHFALHRHDDEETKARNKEALFKAREQLKIKLTEESLKLGENMH